MTTTDEASLDFARFDSCWESWSGATLLGADYALDKIWMANQMVCEGFYSVVDKRVTATYSSSEHHGVKFLYIIQ